MNAGPAKLKHSSSKAALAAVFILLSMTFVRAAILTGSTGSHDPSRMINCNGKYYIYSTGGGMKSSTDKINWSSGTSPFNGVPNSVRTLISTNQGIWAPDVIFSNNKYYLYYSVAASDGLHSAIGLLTSPTLDPAAAGYHWTDVGVVVFTTDHVQKRSAIDPCPFLDTSNNLWLSWGSGYANGATWSDPTIFLTRLDNTNGLASSTDTNQYPVALGHIEGSAIYYLRGYYYAFWNSGGCCSGASSSYTIHLARSPTVTGTYVDKNGAGNSSVTFLSSTVVKNSINGNEHGPGHAGILSEGGIDRVTYHYYPDTGGSVIGEETIVWGADGWPTCGADLAPETCKMFSLNNGLAMGVYQGGTTNGAPIDQETFTGGTSQQWTVDFTTNGSTADGYYSLTSVGSGKVVDVFQSNTNNGTLINQWTWGGGNNQKWFIEQTSEGYYRMVSKLSQSVIDISGYSDTSGTWLNEMVWNNGVDQQWLLTTSSGSLPAAPTGLTATAGTGQVSLSWTAVGGATRYNVKRGTTNGGPYTTSIGSPTSANFTDTVVTNGVTYYYVVSTVNANGISGKSSQASATPGGLQPPPAAPDGLVAVAVSASQINLTWTDNSTNELNFLIERAPDNTNFTQAGSVGIGVTNYSDTGLSASTVYYYRVRASNLGGNSAYSNTNSATTLAPAPGLVWRGDGAGNAWDMGVSSNWFTGGSRVLFANGADVILDDTGSNNVPVSLTGGLQPASILVSAAKNYTFGGAGALAGAGSLSKSGTGLLTINTTNSHSGGTVIASGTLVAGNIGANSAAWGTGPVTFMGGTVQFNGYGGSTGTGWGGMTNRLNVPAGQMGTLLLPPRWGYSSPFTSPLTGGGTLNVTVDYIRDYFSGDWSAFSGQINVSPRSGTGDFRIDNTGGYVNAAFYVNSGVNFYVINHNNLTVDLGELGGASGAIIGTGNGASTNPTWRIGAKNTTSTYAGVMVDSGVTSLIKTGTGRLILSGANTYSGVTTINDGTLQIGAGGATGTPGTNNIVNNATLTFNRSDTISYGGVISGAGDLDKLGNGTLTLNNAHTYAGATTIESGTLALIGIGSIASSLEINISAGALLDVSGTTGGAMTLTGGKIISGVGAVKGSFTIGSGATLSPGSPIGTLTFSNALTLAPGGTGFFEISKASSNNDVAKVFGALTCGGNLVVTETSGYPLAAGDSFKLFDAAGYSGAFANVNLPPLPAGLGWNTNALNTAGTLSVVIATVPVFSPIFISGNDLVFSGSGGVASAGFYLLGSTNLTLPMSNWTRLVTNQFDDQGNFNFTNLIPPDSMPNFYLLQLP